MKANVYVIYSTVEEYVKTISRQRRSKNLEISIHWRKYFCTIQFVREQCMGCMGNNLKANPIKTRLVLFSRTRKPVRSTIGAFTFFGHKRLAPCWTWYDGSRHNKLFIPVINKRWSEKLLQLKKVVEIITDHCSLNKHLFNIGVVKSPGCSCGFVEETGVHLVGD